MYKLLLVITGFFFYLTTVCQSKDDILITQSMKLQSEAWNEGNLEKFMSTYWNSDSMMFIGKNGVTYGWDKTFKNYKNNYPDTASMGKLDFELIQIKRLSVLYYSVTGRWYLTRTIGNINGSFTLLFKKIKGKWLIVSDHSS